MPTHHTTQMSTPIYELPAELLCQILELVASQRCYGIRRCRLASSRHFHNIASPLLIDTLIIAERMRTLQAGRGIVEHPVFRKTVKHLIWDASYYAEAVARPSVEFSSAVKELPGVFDSDDLLHTLLGSADHYSHRLEEQQSIRRRKIAWSLLRLAVQNCPKLRSVSYPTFLLFHGTGNLSASCAHDFLAT